MTNEREFAKALDEYPEAYDSIYGSPGYGTQTLAKIAASAKELVDYPELPEVYDRLLELQGKIPTAKAASDDRWKRLTKATRPGWDMEALHTNQAGLTPVLGGLRGES